jgi:predicted Na+-dependent transporter
MLCLTVQTSRANFPEAGILLPSTGIVPRADRVTIVFCGTKKSLSQGITIAKVLFASYAVGAAVLPLMLFDRSC